MQQPNQKESIQPQALESPDNQRVSTSAGLASDPVIKNKGQDQSGPSSLVKQSSSISQRPSRKAKTKEAVLKHLNRDVELLVEEKQEKKPSAKRDKYQVAQPTSTNLIGKRSCTRSGGIASVNKSSVQKANLREGSAQQLVPPSIVNSGSSSNENVPIAPFVSSLTTKKASPVSKIQEKDEPARNSTENTQVKNLRSRRNESERKQSTSEAAERITRSIVKSTQRKTEEKQPPAAVVTQDPKKEDVEMESEVSAQEDEKDSENDNMSLLSVSAEELSEVSMSQDSEDEEEEQSNSQILPTKKRTQKLTQKEIAENRALRIKMGKSGIQAASRKAIKQGKDACQRKLWNQKEDDAIVSLVEKYGTKRWTFIAQMLKEDYKIFGRTGKQCRERWHNHLDPNIKKSPINTEEEIIIFDAHKIFGNKWADIAKLLQGRSDNCIKNYYYSTLRKHIRRINKSLKQCQVSKMLNLKVKTLTADILFPLVKEGKITYSSIINIDPKKFEDLEHTMRMIFNHEDGQQVTQRGIIAAAQNRIKVEKTLQEMRDREAEEEEEIRQAAAQKPSQRKSSQQSSDDKMLGKRAVAKYKYEQSQKKKRTKNEDSQSQADRQEESSYSLLEDDQKMQQQVTKTKKSATPRKDSYQNIIEPVGSKHKVQDAHATKNSSKLTPILSEANIQSLSFPKGLQMKPPIQKKQNLQKPEMLQDKMFQGRQDGVINAADVQANPLNPNHQSTSSLHVFKSSLTGNSLSVTGEVTKNKIRNVSNDSNNSKNQPLHDDDKIYKEKKHKKKKNKKEKRSGDKHKKKLLFPFYPLNQNVEEINQQFDFLHSQMNPGNKDQLNLTNQRNSGSKIYPGFYEQMYQAKQNKGAGKDLPQMQGFPPQMPHTCFSQGGHQSFMPHHPFMYHPAYFGQFLPYTTPQQSMEMMMNNPFYRQFKKKDQSSKGNADTTKEKSKQASSEKKKEDQNEETDKKSKNEKDKAEEFMNEMMNQFYQMPPQVQAYYQKNGGGYQFPMGFAPHPAFFHPMTMHGQVPAHSTQRDKHHSSAYHKQFTMPITPNNIQSQVFGGEKQFSQQNAPLNASEIQKQIFKRTHGNFDHQNEGSFSEGTSQNDHGQKQNEEGQNVNQIRSQNHHPHYNHNITVMINQYGPTINQQVPGEGETSQTVKQKTSTEQYAQEAIQNLLPNKQASLKKTDQLNRQQGTASANFKSQFKPQNIGTLNFQQKFQNALNSKGVTPSNQHPPLISASNLLLNNHGFMHNQANQQHSQSQQVHGKDMSSLQQRLFAGTPRLFIGGNGMGMGHQHLKMPTSTTAATAAAFLQNNNNGFVEPLKSTRNVNLHSKETFAGQAGSKLNTKTNAQLTAQKSNNKLITPKVNTMGTDPETYRKNLEKMFQNVNQKQEETNPNECLLSTHGGAFTHKKQTASRENSFQKNSKPSAESCKQGTGRKTVELSQVSKKQDPTQKLFERDSLGLFLVDNRPDNHQLNLNPEPLGSIYTNCHDNLNITYNSSANKNMVEINPELEPPTPNLQLKQEDSILEKSDEGQRETK